MAAAAGPPPPLHIPLPQRLSLPSLTQSVMQRATLACVAAALALLAAAPLAAALLSRPANEGIPPGFAGLWAEEREGVDGGPSMLLSRQWLPDGNGFVMYTQVRAGVLGCWGLAAGSAGLSGGSLLL